MPTADGLDRRLDRIEQNQTEILVRMQTLTDKLDTLNGSVADLSAEVGGAPAHDARGARESLRTRVHDVEASASPVALEAAFARVLANRRTAVWQSWQLRMTMVGVAVSTLFTLLRFAGLGG